MVYHGNFLDLEFKDKNFLNRFKILKTRKSKTNPWTHHLVVVEEDEVENVIKEVKENLISPGFYAHLYNQDGSKVIVIFPDRVFRTNKENLNEAKEHGRKLGIPEKQLDFKPLTFEEEESYYKEER